jgi:LysM repeat protein
MTDQIPNAYEVKVKPRKGKKKTRLAYFKKVVEGKPLMLPSKKPKVTKSKGEILRVSASHKIGGESYFGEILGYDGSSYYYVMDDSTNGEAAGFYIKTDDVETVKIGGIYTVQKGDSLAKISKKVYSSKKQNYKDQIYKANKDVIGKKGKRIKPGQKLFIPYKVD